MPAHLARLPYDGALIGVQAAASALPFGPSPRVWARNSFVLGTFVALQSDLDLTVWFDWEPGPAQLDGLRRLIAIARATAPWVGEVNLYVGDDLAIYRPLLNRFELARDPELAARLAGRELTPGAQSATATEAPDAARVEASVFLSRMLEADLAQLRADPGARQGKWSAHLDAVATELELPRPEPRGGAWDIPAITRAIAGIALGADSGDAVELANSLGRYWDALHAGTPLWRLELEPSWIWWFPHRFCFRATEWEGVRARPARLELARVAEAQIAWEICGMMSQFRLTSEPGRSRTSAGLDRRVHLGWLRRISPLLTRAAGQPDRLRVPMERLSDSPGFG